MKNIEKGKEGEAMASKYLQKKGYKILLRNYRTKYGEIDIVAKRKKLIVFVEVKLRKGDSFGKGVDAINEYKIKRIRKTAEYYLFNNKIDDKDVRFDVISIDFKTNEYKIEHIEGAF